MTTARRRGGAATLLVGLVLGLVLGLGQQAAADAPEDKGRDREKPPAVAAPPADAVTQQAIELAGGTMRFTATAGFVRLTDDKGDPEADVAMTAYTLDGEEPTTRPVTFVINGGPGMASAWLQMGAVGPWRIAMTPSPSASAVPEPNPETWLDLTDLVFIDPVDTGYSRFLVPGDDVRKRLWSIGGDIEGVAQAIRRWLDKAGRVTSPLYLLGESYGGFRAPRLARELAEHEGVGLRGLVMVSPVLDFGNHSGALDALGYAASLPSMTATARAASTPALSRADLADAEDYAAGPFLTDVLRGVADPAATARVVDRVAALTGLDPALVRRHRGLISRDLFVHEHDRTSHAVDSVYDATVALPDPFPEDADDRSADPMLDGLRAPLTEAVLAVYQKLHWHPEGQPYRLVSDAAGRQWDFGHGFVRPQSFEALRQALALDPALHVVIVQGLFDLVCPYYATQLLLNQIPPEAGGTRVRLVALPGGHMLYSRDDSRRALKAEAATLIRSPAP